MLDCLGTGYEESSRSRDSKAELHLGERATLALMMDSHDRDDRGNQRESAVHRILMLRIGVVDELPLVVFGVVHMLDPPCLVTTGPKSLSRSTRGSAA